MTAGRIYKEAMSKSYMKEARTNLERVAIVVPVGCARFKNEISHQLNFVLEERFKRIVHNSFFEHGGHFAALQLPKVLHEDLVAFVKKTF